MHPPLPVLLRRHRYAILFGALLVTLTLGPLLEALSFGHRVMELLLCVSLLAALFPIGKRVQRHLLLVLVVVAQGLRWWARDAGGALALSGAVLWGVLATVAAWHAVRYALSSQRVQSEHLSAALSAYLLLGLCGGVVFAAVSAISPGSMAVGGQPAQDGLGMGSALYFSFVTLATLGYGDITPVSQVARGLATLEAITGQLFLALLVARLVGLRSSAPSQ
ncbi:ion channel [Stenotrophomonas sp.]|uniref:potassium channel family protein n=1 Tax=Stenotrophomonas sp. TaxID=69392 RepID=UPI00289766C1|nr:ion channel [Stenotrophomonas sp.]